MTLHYDSCLTHLSPVICPFCREPFHPKQHRRLIADLDLASHTPAEDADIRPLPPKEDAPELVAKSLHTEFAKVVTKGSDEANLRKLIDKCSTFLKSQPRETVSSESVSCMFG